MSNEITISVVGNIASAIEVGMSSNGDPSARFRIASTARRFDRATNQWVDADTAYFTVSCWRGLARNVARSLDKGMPVLVYGRLRTRDVEQACGDRTHRKHFQDIEALAVGPDLSRGVVKEFERVKRDAVVLAEARAVEEALRLAGLPQAA